jgi:hypothetical protein
MRQVDIGATSGRDGKMLAGMPRTRDAEVPLMPVDPDRTVRIQHLPTDLGRFERVAVVGQQRPSGAQQPACDQQPAESLTPPRTIGGTAIGLSPSDKR